MTEQAPILDPTNEPLREARQSRVTLRFADATLETDFGAAQASSGRPILRVACAVSAANWLCGDAIVSSLALPDVRVMHVVALAVMVPVSLVALGLTWRVRTFSGQQFLGGGVNCLAGLSFLVMLQIGGAFERYGAVTLIATMVFVLVLRLRFVGVVLASAPYVVVYAFIAVTQEGSLGLAPDMFLLGSSWLLCGFSAYLTERSTRRQFLQRLLIEAQQRELHAQQETLARERAWSEALLKSELSHQVAERSRELGDALARVGGPVAVALPAPGDLFHTRYRVVRALGEGGMGAVFEVERLTDSLHLALKLVTGQVAGATAARFAREAEIGARVHHRNLISIVDVGIAEGGAPFLVMELVQGGSLEGRREQFGEVAWGLPVLKQIALGLSALHESGVVHRDLKPGNVLLDVEAAPVAKISDFGISRFDQLGEAAVIDVEGPTMGASTPKRSDLTGTGILLGTPLYMAPEAARGGKSLDAAADVFAFGILAYEVLTGRGPFETPAVLMALAGKALPAPAPIEDTVLARDARDAVLACLSEDPKDRPTARRVCEALGAA